MVLERETMLSKNINIKHLTLKNDMEIISRAELIAKENCHIYLISHDLNLLTACRSIKKQEKLKYLNCGNLKEFVEYLKKFNEYIILMAAKNIEKELKSH